MNSPATSPGFSELWEGLTHARMDIAELKGMIKMHFRDNTHHQPPCATAAGLQRTLHAAMGEMRRRALARREGRRRRSRSDAKAPAQFCRSCPPSERSFMNSSNKDETAAKLPRRPCRHRRHALRDRAARQFDRGRTAASNAVNVR